MQRASEGMLQRVLSQKDIPTRPFLSPSASLKEVKTSKAILQFEPN